MKNPSMSKSRRFLKHLIDLAIVLALVQLLFVLLAGCSHKPNDSRGANDAGNGPALSAETVVAHLEQQFSRKTDYVGRVEAARSSELGFELAGTLLAVHADEGSSVEKGQLLAKLDSARLQARRKELEAAAEEAKSAVKLAEATFERTKNLVARKAMSEQRLDEARQSRDSSRAAARRIDAQLDSVDVDLSKSGLTAPYAGTISARLLDEGSIVTPGQPVLRILETGQMEIRAGLSARAAGDLVVGQTLDVRTQGSQRLNAKVEHILPQRVRGTRTVDVILKSSGAGVRDGDLVSILIETKVRAEGFWLPRMALVGSARGLWSCYVAQPLEGQSAPTGLRCVESRELEILHQDGERVFVAGGLRDGDHVVASGVHRLVAGQMVLETKDALATTQHSFH
jgi:RND family efflux transporter MFP subunit